MSSTLSKHGDFPRLNLCVWGLETSAGSVQSQARRGLGCCSSNIVKSIEKVSVGMIVGRLVYDGSFESVYEKTLFSGVSH